MVGKILTHSIFSHYTHLRSGHDDIWVKYDAVMTESLPLHPSVVCNQYYSSAIYSEPKKCPNDLLMLKDWFISQELLIRIKCLMYHWKGLHYSFPKQVILLHNIA